MPMVLVTDPETGASSGIEFSPEDFNEVLHARTFLWSAIITILDDETGVLERHIIPADSINVIH